MPENPIFDTHLKKDVCQKVGPQSQQLSRTLLEDHEDKFRKSPPLSWKYAAAQLSSPLDSYLVIHLGKESTMTATGASGKTMDYRRGCGSGVSPAFQGYSRGFPP